jgi:GNAT superfamily N-acetyltransferase
MVRITPVSSKKALKAFVDFPHDLYASDPHYVPEIHIGQRDILTPGKHPFHDYGSIKAYLAYHDDTIVGRIVSIHNPRYNDHFKSNVGFFGFFDCIDNSEVCQALLAQAEADAKERGFDRLIGPTNLTTNDTAGVLVDGFNDAPRIMMTYNRPYLVSLLEQSGYGKEMDLYAYDIPTADVSDRTLRLSDAIETRLKRSGITVRNIRLKDIDKEAVQMLEVYNEAWIDNWGFVPFTKDEFNFLKNDLKLIAVEDWGYIAEHEGRTVGFSLTLPDINEILQRINRGRLLPTGIFKLLLGKKKTKRVRIAAMGVRQDYRKKGIEAVFFARNIKAAKKYGVLSGEASWVLENNEEMIAAAEALNGTRYKTYRLYAKSIS